MTTRTRCPDCRAALTLADVEPGDEATCPECDTTFTVPKRVTAAAVADDEPRPAKPKKKKAGKKKKKAAESAVGGKQILSGFGVMAFLFAMLIVRNALLDKKPEPEGGANAAGGANAGGGADAPAPGGFVVFDTPGGGPAAPADANPKPTESRKPAPVVALAAPAAEQPVEGWALKPDPPAEPPADLAADPTAPGSRPLFASGGGPFVAVDNPVPLDWTPGKNPPGGSTVFDARTGKPVGALPGHGGIGRLSPDGQWLVTLGPIRAGAGTGAASTLSVLRRGEKDPPAKPAAELRLPGRVAWVDFVAADRVAVYTFDPNPVVCVYAAADGKVVQTIPVTTEMHPPPVPPGAQPGAQPAFYCEPKQLLGAVSPGGRYVVLGGKSALAVLDLAAGKQVAEVPVNPTKEAAGHRGIGFRPDGGELYAATQDQAAGGAVLQLRGWDLATGRRRFEVRVRGPYGALPGWCGPPLPGPEPGTLILPYHTGTLDGWAMAQLASHYEVNPGAVIDTTAGVVHYSLPHKPVRWAGPGRLFGFGPVTGNPRVLLSGDERPPEWEKEPGLEYGAGVRMGLTVPFDRAGYEKKAGATVAATAARPPVKPGHRTGLTPAKPEPPAAWAAPPTSPAPAVPSGAPFLPHWPTATNGVHAAAVTFDFQAEPRHQYPVTWRRYDLTTGKEEGPPVRLWPWAEMSERHVTMAEKFPAPPTGVSADGKRLAMRDPADPHRVDVWDADGKRLGGFVPYGPGVPVGWVGFVGGRLVTAGGGRLTGWDGPAGKAVWEVEGGYTTVTAAPGGGWVAALAGDNIDLIDGASGKCLARCPCPPGKEYITLAVSPDGKALAAARPGDEKVARTSPTYLDKRPVVGLLPAEYVADLWDLGTGARASVPFGFGVCGFINWVGGEHLFAGAGVGELIDRKAEAVVGVYGYPGRGTAWEGPQPFAGTPDGRLWASVPAPDLKPGENRRGWRAQPFPNPAEEVDQLLFAADREILRPVDGPIRVEVDLGTEERGRLAAARVAADLRKRGFVIGPKGWALRISHAVEDTGDMLTNGPADKGIPIPQVKFTWRLYAPDGGMVWEGSATGRFLAHGSRYFTKSKSEGPGGVGMNLGMRTDYFEFGGRDPRRAFAAEILDKAADGVPGPAVGPPAAVIRAGGASKPRPLGRTLDIKAGP